MGKELGDSVHVTYVLPAQYEKILKEAGVLEAFLKQPNYIQREQINYIEVAKKPETKTNRMNALLK